MHYPEQVKWSIRKFFLQYYPRYAAAAKRIVTVSEYSKNDIVEQLHVPPGKVDVVYNGANKLYRPLPEEEKQSIRARYSDGREYYLYVGSMHPRKNVDRLLAAFDRFKEASGSDKKLLLVGREAWMTGSIRIVYDSMKHREDVRFMGYRGVDELAKIVASARALTYVSLFEGFGIPILEAMNCDVPSLTSNVSSMPEVGGKAAIYVNPESVANISEGLQKLEDDELRKTLSRNCTDQRAKFSWDQTASRFWQNILRLT